MATHLDAAELLILRAAWLEDNHKPYEKESAMAKLFASDTAMWAAVEGVQVFGDTATAKNTRWKDLCGTLKSPRFTKGQTK